MISESELLKIENTLPLTHDEWVNIDYFFNTALSMENPTFHLQVALSAYVRSNPTFNLSTVEQALRLLRIPVFLSARPVSELPERARLTAPNHLQSEWYARPIMISGINEDLIEQDSNYWLNLERLEGAMFCAMG